MTSETAFHPDLMDSTDRADHINAASIGLRRAADRLTKPHTWTQGAAARNARGEPVAYADPTAIRWCLTGAMRLELHNASTTARIIAYRALKDALDYDPAHWNDRCTSALQVATAARVAANSLEPD